MYSEGGHTFRNGGGYIPNPPSRLEDGKGVVATSETRDGRPRFNPYYRGGRKRDDNPGRDHVSPHSGPRRADSSHPERPESSDRIKSWFKVTIPHGKKYEKSWLLGVLQNVSKVPFTAVSYHCAHNRAHFFIDDLETAQALKRVSRTFTDRDNFKVTVLIRSSAPPYLNQSKGIKAEDMAHIKSCMQKRYQGATQSLDMKALRADPDLITNKVDFIMNRRCYMQVMLQMIEENVPELLGLDISYNKLYKLDNMEELYLRAPKLKSLNVSHNMLKSVWELDKIKQLKLDELWVDGNPLCDLFQDKTTYIRAVRERFPNLLRLDGQELPPPITFDVETPTALPPCKGSYLGTDDIKGLVLRFLQEYYVCYDSEDIQGLLNAYYDEACCTLSIPCIQGQNTSRSSLGEYLKDSRNIKRLKDPTLRFKLTKRKHLNVVRFLNELPKTQHDLNSFVVDVTTHTPPKKEKRETKAKSAKTKQRSKLVDEVATEEMSKEQLEEDIVRLQEDIARLREELDQERKERNSFQMEQEKTRSFWEITRRQLYEKNSELRYKEREMKEAEELHQVEIKMLKQKLKHLVYDHQNKVAELKAEGCVAMKLAQKEHHRTQESTLCSDIRRLQVESKEKELANERVRKSLKKKHDEEIGHIRNDFERQVTEMKVKYDKKMQVLRDELELCRKREIQELEERNNGHIVTLTENHEKAFSDIKEFYNDISINNLILKQQIEDMRKREDRLEKEMAEVQLQNLRLVEPLQKAREEIADLNKQLPKYEKDKMSLSSTRLRLKSTEKELNALKWQHEVLEQRLETIQSERDELDRKFTAAINEVQQKSGFKNVIVERKLLALGESLEKKEAQLSEVLAASNLDPTALSTITRKLEDVLGAKNNTIKDLQYELAKVRKAHNELLRTYQAKMHPVAIPVDEPGLKPRRAYPDKALFRVRPGRWLPPLNTEARVGHIS